MRGKENLVWRYEGYAMRPARFEDAESYMSRITDRLIKKSYA